MPSIISTLRSLRKSGSLPDYIEYIRLPRFKDVSEGTEINFNFPLTAFIGGNGTRKSSVLKAIAGCPKGRSPRKHWFSTPVDPIEGDTSGGKRRNSIVHAYKGDDGNVFECLKSRSDKKGRNLDYWETDKPRKWAGMDIGVKRQDPVEKHVEYLDFRSILPAFDKCFNFSSRSDVQDYLRRRSAQLKAVIEEPEIRKMGDQDQNKMPVKFSPEKLKKLSQILGRTYTKATYIRHKFFEGWADTVYLETEHHKYSEAFAGSGETAVAVMIHRIEDAPDGSLILLDEPEVSLHPEAQKKLKEYLLEKIKTNKHQIIISTHSPFLTEGLPKEAIKVFRFSSQTGETDVIEDLAPEEAFTVIGHLPSSNLITIEVEDPLAKILIEAALKTEDEAVRARFRVKVAGSNGEMLKDMAHGCDSDVFEKHYFVFDGDAAPDHTHNLSLNDRGLCIIDGLTLADKNVKKLAEIVQAQSCRQHVKTLGLDDSPDEKEKEEKYLTYLRYMEERAFYLPKKTPEEIIWSDNQAEKLLESVGMDEDDVSKKMTEIKAEQNYKNKFVKLCRTLKSGDVSAKDILAQQEQFIMGRIIKNTSQIQAIKGTIQSIRDHQAANEE